MLRRVYALTRWLRHPFVLRSRLHGERSTYWHWRGSSPLFPLLAIAFICTVSCTRNDTAARPGERGTDVPPFESASTVAETLRWQRAVPTDTAWWDVVGEQLAWSLKNVHQLFPTVNIYRDGPVRALGYQLDENIADHLVETPTGSLPFANFLRSEHTTVMGVVILHRGEIVFESYPRMQYYEKPAYWSVTKVLVSALVAILEDRGLVDIEQPIGLYIADLEKSQLAEITVRNLLDMASGIDCSDNYVDFESCYYRFEASMGDAYRTPSSPDNPYDMMIDFDYGYWADQGTGYDYSGINTFLLRWLVEEITGMPFQDAFTSEIWRQIGAEADASMFAARNGIALEVVMARLRDLGRFGLLFTPSYDMISDRKIISDRFLDVLVNGGRPELSLNARFGTRPADLKHTTYQWDVYKNNDFHKGGWGGQGLLVNADRDYVAVYSGYFKDREHSEMKLLPVLRQMLESIYGATSTSL